MSGLWLTVADLGPEWETSEYAEEAVKSASYLMWALSGRKYTGTTTVTERYVRFTPLINTRLLQEAAIINSRINKALQIVEPWVMAETRIRLRGQPVREVLSVRNVGGEIVSPDSYFVVDHAMIQFSKGALIVPADIEVSYTYGSTIPPLGKMAARRVAIEFVKLWEGDDDCALPDRVTSISRQGVSYTVLDTQDFIQEMRLGIYEIDLFLKTVNPNKAQKRAKVFSPDIPMARRYTPKGVVYPVTNLDMTVTRSGGELEIDLEALDAEFIETEPGLTKELIIGNWGNSTSMTLPSAAVDISNGVATLTVGYTDAVGVLGLADPGTWSLYVTNTSDEISLIAYGNLVVNVQQA